VNLSRPRLAALLAAGVLTSASAAILPGTAKASKCEAGTVFNPITAVRWTCIFPITIDVALMTEVLPTWQSATLGAIIQPEAVLFGNPAAGLATASTPAAAQVSPGRI